MTDINSVFCRQLLKVVHTDVRKAFPKIGNIYLNASVTCTSSAAGRREYFVEIDVPDRPRFTWDGRADSATDARAKAWQALLRTLEPPSFKVGMKVIANGGGLGFSYRAEIEHIHDGRALLRPLNIPVTASSVRTGNYSKRRRWVRLDRLEVPDRSTPPNELDYIALSRASLSVRQSNNRRTLTPRGKYRADELARAIATTTDIHVCAYGRTPGAWHVRCSCGFSSC